jgi:hypothetical protein
MIVDIIEQTLKIDQPDTFRGAFSPQRARSNWRPVIILSAGQDKQI